MDVENSLACVCSIVYYQAETAAYTIFSGQIASFLYNLAEQFGILWTHVPRALDMLLGNYQKMGRRLGAHVPEGQNVGVFVEFVGGYFAITDFAENTFIAHVFSPGRSSNQLNQKTTGRVW